MDQGVDNRMEAEIFYIQFTSSSNLKEKYKSLSKFVTYVISKMKSIGNVHTFLFKQRININKVILFSFYGVIMLRTIELKVFKTIKSVIKKFESKLIDIGHKFMSIPLKISPCFYKIRKTSVLH